MKKLSLLLCAQKIQIRHLLCHGFTMSGHPTLLNRSFSPKYPYRYFDACPVLAEYCWLGLEHVLSSPFSAEAAIKRGKHQPYKLKYNGDELYSTLKSRRVELELASSQ